MAGTIIQETMAGAILLETMAVKYLGHTT